MSAEIRSFDEYWRSFVLLHFRASSRRPRLIERLATARSALSNVTRGPRALVAVPWSRLAPLLPERLRDRSGREPLRWAAAAWLKAVGEVLAGTMEREIERATLVDTAGWLRPPPPDDDTTTATPEPVPAPAAAPERPGWAVWM